MIPPSGQHLIWQDKALLPNQQKHIFWQSPYESSDDFHMDLNFEDFFQSGRFGEIILGTERDDVMRILGAPDDVSMYKKPLIWKYGNLQLTFEQGVRLILLRFEPDDRWHPNIRVAGWAPPSAMTLHDFINTLESMSIPLNPNPELTYDEQKTFFVGQARASALFVEDVLSKISLLGLGRAMD